MPFHLLKHEPLEPGLRRIAKEQIGIALQNCEDDTMPVSKQVHSLRARCKKMRGLLRLGQPLMGNAFSVEDKKFRDAARAVAAHRDADVYAQTIQSLNNSGGAVEQPPSPGRTADIERSLTILRTCRDGVGEWSLDLYGFADIAPGFSHTYRKCQSALQQARINPSDRNFHKLRKWAKYHWYQIRILERINKQELRKRRKKLRKLQLLLGDAHDLAVTQARLDSRPDPDKTLLNRTIERKQDLYNEAITIGQRVFGTPADEVIADFSRWWVGWGA